MNRRSALVAFAIATVGWTAPVALSAAVGYLDYSAGDPRPRFWPTVLVASVGWYYWGLAALLLSRVARPQPIRVMQYSGAAIFAILVHAGVCTLAIRTWQPAYAIPSLAIHYREVLIGWLAVDLMVCASVLAVTQWAESNRRARERELQSAALSAQLAQAQLGALRMQLHPHFLFNALNTMTVLARERDNDTVVRMLTQLGNVLRQVMRGDLTQEVPLRQELALLRDYVAIEEVRFADRLSVRWSVSDDVLDAAVPSLILQPLVENAFRHGIAREPGDRELEIRAVRDGERLVLAVRNDGPSLTPLVNPAGLGLANTRARLDCLYGLDGSLVLSDAPGGGTLAMVSLPLRIAT